ncbi:MAG: DEAD/DEAH box helicase [Desulfobacteraceae bacterium]
MSFEKLGLGAELLKAVEKRGYTTPTPVQAQAIPVILGGEDLFARAQTGTGKTDAFALPLVELLSRKKSKQRHPRALVLAPTRELAGQVGESFQVYARRVGLRCTVVYGGVAIVPQKARLRRGIDILVATPGRLLDLLGQRAVTLFQTEYLVFDEADRMLDLGFSEEITAIMEHLPKQRRTMLFSATDTPQVKTLARGLLKNARQIAATPAIAAAELVAQKVHLVDPADKFALLVYLITREQGKQMLVFTRTRHGANRLVDKLAAKGIEASPLHSSKSQSLRTRTLKAFKNGEIQTLVATDVAARGLDIHHLPCVVNYDMPEIPEDYIHRIGRTGRAGTQGVALSLVTVHEQKLLKAVETLLREKIPREAIRGYTQESAVPDFVLLRPDNPASEKKADRSLKKIVTRRNQSRQPPENPKGKNPVKGKKPAKDKTTVKGKSPAAVRKRAKPPGKNRA